MLQKTISDVLSCRRILDIMVILSFMLDHMMRSNLSLAIVAMVPNNQSATTSATFDWNEEEKNDILGCFFWGALVSAVPGGRLAELYGSRIVMGTSMLLAGLLTIATPLACYTHFYCIIAVRGALGLVLGTLWPAILPISAKWVPPSESSKFMAHTISGSLGIALAMPLYGFLIAYVGWPSVFYFVGVIVTGWAVSWFFLIYDSPSQHPRITKAERDCIEGALGPPVVTTNRKIPWASILKSAPVWAIICANFVALFYFYTVFNQLPTYMDQVLHYNIKENGLLSGLPYIARYVAAIGSGYLADHWRQTNKFTTTTIRKFFTCIAFLGPSVVFLIQAFWGYNRIVSIAVFTTSLAFLGLATAGFFANSLDIAPPFSGTIFGIANVFGSFAGYFSTKVVAFVTKDNQDFEQWRIIFFILIGMNLFGAVSYFILGSGRLQEWSRSSEETKEEESVNTYI